MDHLPNEPESREHGPLKTFLEHLEDLRWVLVKIASVIAIAWLICFYKGPLILDLLQQPLKWSGVEEPSKFLRVFGPADAFSISFQLALYAGLVLSAPFVIYFIADFVIPALTKRERRFISPAFWLGSIFFFAGVFFCYFLMLPTALRYSRLYTEWLHISVEFWTVGSYVSFVTNFMIGMGVAFEFPLIVLALVNFGVLDYAKLSKVRRHVIVLSFILGAVLTTPEPITMFMMAIPLIIMYEICIWIAWFAERRKKQAVMDQG